MRSSINFNIFTRPVLNLKNFSSSHLIDLSSFLRSVLRISDTAFPFDPVGFRLGRLKSLKEQS